MNVVSSEYQTKAPTFGGVTWNLSGPAARSSEIGEGSAAFLIGFERNFKIGNMNVTFNPQFGGAVVKGTHQTEDGETTHSLGFTSYGTMSVTYNDSVEISPEGMAALDEANAEKERNYASLVSEMSRRLKDIFNALVAWSQDIIQKTRGDNNDAFGAKNIAETIENSLGNFEDDMAELDAETGEINHKEKFNNAVAKYYDAFKNTMAEIFEGVKENAEEFEGEFPEEMTGDLLDLLKQAAESGEEIFVALHDIFTSDGKRSIRIEQADEQAVHDVWNAQLAQMRAYYAEKEQATLSSSGAANVAQNKPVDDPAWQELITKIAAMQKSGEEPLTENLYA